MHTYGLFVVRLDQPPKTILSRTLYLVYSLNLAEAPLKPSGLPDLTTKHLFRLLFRVYKLIPALITHKNEVICNQPTQ